MQTSLGLLFSSLLFSGDYSGLLSSSVLVFPLVTIAACARTDRRKEEKEKQHRFSVSCCGQGRALPILVLVGRGEERESSVIRSHTSKAEEGRGKHSNRDGQAAKHSNLMFGFCILCTPVGSRRQCRAMTTSRQRREEKSGGDAWSHSHRSWIQ
jgi:hypothetical protein